MKKSGTFYDKTLYHQRGAAMTKTFCFKTITAILVASVLFAGCQDSSKSRVVTAPEIEESNQRRIEYIDSLNIPEAQKQAMKDRLGKPQTTQETRGK
ncbi:hypothetical protein CCB80_07975 [Armatimonadetes bacterium Uphvl-Ar1]|nr:hypothetical protein CCB80_07975 [Armatimonadetes bacterium Uphvl-Ar1]